MKYDPKEQEPDDNQEQEQKDKPTPEQQEASNDWIDNLIIDTVTQQNKEFGPQL